MHVYIYSVEIVVSESLGNPRESGGQRMRLPKKLRQFYVVVDGGSSLPNMCLNSLVFQKSSLCELALVSANSEDL